MSTSTNPEYARYWKVMSDLDYIRWWDKLTPAEADDWEQSMHFTEEDMTDHLRHLSRGFDAKQAAIHWKDDPYGYNYRDDVDAAVEEFVVTLANGTLSFGDAVWLPEKTTEDYKDGCFKYYSEKRARASELLLEKGNCFKYTGNRGYARQVFLSFEIKTIGQENLCFQWFQKNGHRVPGLEFVPLQVRDETQEDLFYDLADENPALLKRLPSDWPNNLRDALKAPPAADAAPVAPTKPSVDEKPPQAEIQALPSSPPPPAVVLASQMNRMKVSDTSSVVSDTNSVANTATSVSSRSKTPKPGGRKRDSLDPYEDEDKGRMVYITKRCDEVVPGNRNGAGLEEFKRWLLSAQGWTKEFYNNMTALWYVNGRKCLFMQESQFEAELQAWIEHRKTHALGPRGKKGEK